MWLRMVLSILQSLALPAGDLARTIIGWPTAQQVIVSDLGTVEWPRLIPEVPAAEPTHPVTQDPVRWLLFAVARDRSGSPISDVRISVSAGLASKDEQAAGEGWAVFALSWKHMPVAQHLQVTIAAPLTEFPWPEESIEGAYVELALVRCSDFRPEPQDFQWETMSLKKCDLQNSPEPTVVTSVPLFVAHHLPCLDESFLVQTATVLFSVAIRPRSWDYYGGISESRMFAPETTVELMQYPYPFRFPGATAAAWNSIEIAAVSTQKGRSVDGVDCVVAQAKNMLAERNFLPQSHEHVQRKSSSILADCTLAIRLPQNQIARARWRDKTPLSTDTSLGDIFYYWRLGD